MKWSEVGGRRISALHFLNKIASDVNIARSLVPPTSLVDPNRLDVDRERCDDFCALSDDSHGPLSSKHAGRPAVQDPLAWKHLPFRPVAVAPASDRRYR